jgi:FdhD protein
LVGDVTEIASIAVDWQANAAAVKTRLSVQDVAEKTVHRIVTTGCAQGTAFGDVLSHIDRVHLPSSASARISQRGLYRLLEVMREQETLHRGAGSVHGCALFCAAELLAFVEDVGRHNAIDTIVGWMAQHGVAGGDKIFYTTGRLTGEMVMKSAQIGVPIMVSRNGATAMGLDVANKLGMILIGRAVKRRFLCYIGAERFDSEPEPRVE